MAVAFSNDSLEIENAMQLFYHTLSEKERRRYVAVEAVKLGYGGQSYIASIVGCNRDTVASGIAESPGLARAYCLTAWTRWLG
jgi:hypothetical protein